MRLLPLSLGAGLLIGGLGMAIAQTSTVTAGPNGVSGGTTITNNNGQPCRVVNGDSADAANPNGTLSSSVTAGPNGVHSSTTGGPSVTVHSGNGSSSSSTSVSGSGGTTVMSGTGSGDCTVTVNPGDK